MKEIAHSIDLDLSRKLQSREYRRKFFWAESSARIAAQLIALRKRRGLNQKQVAEIAGTKQPAISRAEQADYQNWNLNSIRRSAEAMDARVRVLIEPSEDILQEYEQLESELDANSAPEGGQRQSAPQTGGGATKADHIGDAPQTSADPVPLSQGMTRQELHGTYG
jgi:transcriptional regulator with XRE-family HTH domain